MDDNKKTKTRLITELEELRNQNTQLRNFIDNSKDVLYRMSLPDGKYDYINPAAKDVLGYSPEEFYSNPLLIKKIIHPEWHNYFEQQRSLLLAGYMPPVYEYEIIHKSGEIRWMNQRNVLVFDDRGKPVAIEGIVTDITEFKKTEESLRISESRLLEAQKMAHLGHWYWDIKTGDVEWSDEVYNIFQLDPAEFTPQIDSIQAMSPWPEEHQRDKELIQRAIESHEQGSYEQKFLYPDGNIGYYFSTFQGIYDDDGNLYAITGTVQNITDRKRAEEALRESQKRFSETLDSMMEGCQIIGYDWRYIYVNNAVALHGHTTKEALIGKTMMEVFPGIEQTELFGILRECMEKRSTQRFDNEFQFPDGSSQWFELSIQPSPEGLFILSIDITERKKAEEALRNSEARFRDLVDMLPEAVFETDKKLMLTFANQRALELFGYSKEEMEQGLYGLDMLTPEDRDRARENMEKRFAGTYDGPVEYMAVKKDKTIFPILFHANLIKKGKKILGFRGIIVDITEQKRVEMEKDRLEEQYRQAQKVESIGRLAGGVAHDLNNLLTPILGYGEMMLSDLDSDDVCKEPVEEILRAGLRAKDLVSQLLAFSRKQTLEYKTLDVKKIISGIEKLLRRTIREDVEITVIPSSEPLTIRADIGQIEQVIMNLAVNAQDAMPEGGRLTIETARIKLDDSYVENHFDSETGDYAMLALSDTGCGMDEEIRKQIFEPFFSTKGELGTGLGLATVYGIIKQHEGNIFVYSEPGEGTTFKVYLPLYEKEHTEKSIRKEHVENLRGSETILLAEDNEHVRRLTGTILRRHGYTVLEAENGERALSILDGYSGTVNLLLSDVVMPGMNGSELFAQAVKKVPDLKVLYMSGYTDDVIAHHGILDEGIQFIQKPFSLQALTSKVREALDNN